MRNALSYNFINSQLAISLFSTRFSILVLIAYVHWNPALEKKCFPKSQMAKPFNINMIRTVNY